MSVAAPLTTEEYGVAVGTSGELVEVLQQLNALDHAVEFTRLSTVSSLLKVNYVEDLSVTVAALHFQAGFTWQAARQLVDVARALDELPLVRAAYGKGSLSWKQLVLITSLGIAAGVGAANDAAVRRCGALERGIYVMAPRRHRQ